MDKFDHDFYEFATSSNNFESIFDIGNSFHKIKEKLLTDFWIDVIANIKTQKDLDGWIIWNEENMIKSVSRLGIYNQAYLNEKCDSPSVSTCFLNWGDGRIVVGLYFNKEIKKMNFKGLRKEISQNFNLEWRLAPESYSLPIYKFMDDNFNSFNSLKKILPDEGGWLAKQYVETLMNTHKSLYTLINNFGVKN